MWLVLLLYALFASVFTASKLALASAEPFFLVGSRMLIAGSGMLVFQYFRDKQAFSLKKGSLWRILRLALFNIYLTNVFEFWGLKYLTSFKTCFIYSLSPFLSVLFSYLFFSEKLGMKKWLGLLVGFLGFIPILISKTTSEEISGTLWIFSWAELAVVIAVISSVYGWLLLKQVVTVDGLSPIIANGFSMTIGGIFALTHSFFTEDWNPVPVTDFWTFVECTLFLIIVSNSICYNLYGFLLKKFSATFISLAGLTTPIFAALFGWLIHDEVTSANFWVSFLIVFCGLFMFYREELKSTPLLESKWVQRTQSLVRFLKMRLREEN
jgi:drug/metabolite transporter (DMT)-like permease